jgi:hypothetical protein
VPQEFTEVDGSAQISHRNIRIDTPTIHLRPIHLVYPKRALPGSLFRSFEFPVPRHGNFTRKAAEFRSLQGDSIEIGCPKKTKFPVNSR